MLRTAIFDHANWTELLGELAARGYGDAKVQRVTVTLSAAYGPLENIDATPFDTMKDIALVLLLAYAMYTQTCGRARRG